MGGVYAVVFDSCTVFFLCMFRVEMKESGTISANDDWYYQTDSIERSIRWEEFDVDRGKDGSSGLISAFAMIKPISEDSGGSKSISKGSMHSPKTSLSAHTTKCESVWLVFLRVCMFPSRLTDSATERSKEENPKS